MLAILRTAGVEPIDLHAAFADRPNPRALFRYAGSHYNEAGYLAVAEAIEQALTTRATARLE